MTAPNASGQVLAAGRDVIVGGNLVLGNEMRSRDPFFLRQQASVVFAYPGPMVYRYVSKFGDSLAPVGVAMVLEATNKRTTVAKVASYTVDVAVGGEWIRLPNLQPLNPTQFFWVDNGNLKTSRRLDFTSNGFDFVARDKSLAAGETISGWVFLEWPPELRRPGVVLGTLRITLENSHGETQTTQLERQIAQEPGASLLGGGSWHFMPGGVTDLSALKVMPHTDLLGGFRDGSLK